MRKYSLKEFLTITFGTVIIASAVYFFMQPGNVIVGSASALAMVISNFIPVPVSAITFVLNMILLVISYFFVSKEFAYKTVYATILFPAILRIYEVTFPNFQSITQDPFLDMLGYIFIVSIGIAMLFSCNSSTGGIEVVSKLMNTVFLS